MKTTEGDGGGIAEENHPRKNRARGEHDRRTWRGSAIFKSNRRNIDPSRAQRRRFSPSPPSPGRDSPACTRKGGRAYALTNSPREDPGPRSAESRGSVWVGPGNTIELGSYVIPWQTHYIALGILWEIVYGAGQGLDQP